jgi:hypothetical protein
MLRLPWSPSQLVIVLSAFLFFNCSVAAAEKESLNNPISMAPPSVTAGFTPVLAANVEEPESVVDKIAADNWYLFDDRESLNAFIQKYLLNIADETAAPAPSIAPPVAQKSAAAEVKEVAKEPAASRAPSPMPAPTVTPPASPAVSPPAVKASPLTHPPAPTKPAPAKPQSILQMIEGHEEEFKISVVIALGSFVLGWICGGSYYVRRERKRRGKLRF